MGLVLSWAALPLNSLKHTVQQMPPVWITLYQAGKYRSQLLLGSFACLDLERHHKQQQAWPLYIASDNVWLPAGDVDIQAPNVEEARLLQSPVGATQKRLAELLEEWPEHPVLMQLDAICCRLQGEQGGAWVILAFSMTCCLCMLCCLVGHWGPL